jgi:hypothetical protein
MPVHIDQLNTDVIPEPEPQASSRRAPDAPWDEEERARETSRRISRDLARTRAEGFDD